MCKYAGDFIEINDDTSVETVLDWYRKQFSKTRDKEATSSSDLRQELKEGLIDRIDREVLNQVLKDATLASMIQEFKASNIHPAESVIAGIQIRRQGQRYQIC